MGTRLVRRGLLAVRFAWWNLRSFLVLRWYRALYADLHVGRRVWLGRNVDIRVIKGGSLIIGSDTVIDAHSTLVAEGEMVIGDKSFIGAGTVVVAMESVRIGRNALIAAYTTIRDQDHSFGDRTQPYRLQGLTSSRILIGENVWLGTKTTVLRGVTIGDNAVVGANSVVTKPIAADSVVAGAPAKPLKRKA